jgi:hypothetical protein
MDTITVKSSTVVLPASSASLDFLPARPVKSVVLALALLVILASIGAGAAFADDKADEGDKPIDVKAITNLEIYYPEYEDENGSRVSAWSGNQPDEMNLVYFSVLFVEPPKTPVSYRISWSGRSNGSWRSVDKPNTARAGNAIVKHDSGASSELVGLRVFHVGPATKGISLNLPAGQALRVKVRAQYRNSKGPWSETIVINTPNWMESQGY